MRRRRQRGLAVRKNDPEIDRAPEELPSVRVAVRRLLIAVEQQLDELETLQLPRVRMPAKMAAADLAQVGEEPEIKAGPRPRHTLRSDRDAGTTVVPQHPPHRREDELPQARISSTRCSLPLRTQHSCSACGPPRRQAHRDHRRRLTARRAFHRSLTCRARRLLASRATFPRHESFGSGHSGRCVAGRRCARRRRRCGHRLGPRAGHAARFGRHRPSARRTVRHRHVCRTARVNRALLHSVRARRQRRGPREHAHVCEPAAGGDRRHAADVWRGKDGWQRRALSSSGSASFMGTPAWMVICGP
jgi:hypothetical protein